MGIIAPAAIETHTSRRAFAQSVDIAQEQFAVELFYRLQVVEGIQISPDVEHIVAPALQPSRDLVADFGLRLPFTL